MIRCPLCHAAHKDPVDIKGGRVRVCIKCYTKLHPQAPKPQAPAGKAAKNEKGS